MTELNYIDVLATQIEQSLPKELRPKTEARSLYRLYALLMLVKGRSVTLENVHDAWSAWESATDPHHNSIRPFWELEEQTREKDRPYLEAILELATRLEREQKPHVGPGTNG